MDHHDPSTSLARASALRPLGAFEHVIDLYIGRNPVQFSIAIELTVPISDVGLARALAALQQAHPLLAACIDRGGEETVFRRTSRPIPVRIADTHDWLVAASAEQAAPIDQDLGPLARAVMTDTTGGMVVILTFSHQIADGRGALRAAADLLEILDGRVVPGRAVPDSQERLLLAVHEPEADAAPATTAPTPSQRPRPVTRAFDGIPPAIEVAALDRSATERVRATARSHDATVQGALCAAAAQALDARGVVGPIRINAPIDLRSAVGLADDVANRFTATTVVLHDPSRRDLWSLAADATAQLRSARARAREMALMLASLQPADALEAEAAMLAATDADIEITNLGVFPPRSDAAEGVWGPVMLTQVAGERVLGALTHGGALRLTLTSHDDIHGLVDEITGRLS